jgi:hypothetical protein
MKLGVPVPSQIRAFLISRSSISVPLSLRPAVHSVEGSDLHPVAAPSMASPAGVVKLSSPPNRRQRGNGRDDLARFDELSEVLLETL